MFSRQEAIVICIPYLKTNTRPLSSMGLVRLKIREFAQEKGWSLKEVSTRSGINYSTLKTYANSAGMATVDATALLKLARTFEVAIEELIEVVEE